MPHPRVYSFLVHGFRVMDGKRDDLRQASVVAFTPEEAIDMAQRLLVPDAEHHIDKWIVASVQEINPKEAREWASWHDSSTRPVHANGRA